MEEMRNSSEQIQNINNVVDEIAYQTNILSLNAMIEASRSDEQGGFKVVALEVKRLAERSADAASDINKLLNENLKSVQSGVELTEGMSHTFANISAHMQPMVNQIQNIADASFEQNEAIRQIMEGIHDIDKSINSNQDLAEAFNKTVGELRNNASALNRVIKTLQQCIENQ